MWVGFQIIVFITVYASTMGNKSVGKFVAILWTIESFIFLTTFGWLQIFQISFAWFTYYLASNETPIE